MSTTAKILVFGVLPIVVIGGIYMYMNHFLIESVKQSEDNLVKIKLSNNQEYLVELNSGYFDIDGKYKFNMNGCRIELMKGSRIVDSINFNCS